MDSKSLKLTGHTYDMNIKIDPDLGLLQGDQQATFQNLYDVTLNDVGFTLDFNMRRVKGYSMSIEAVMDDRGEGLEWKHPEINGSKDKSL